MHKLALLLLPLAAGGCVSTVASVVTAPVRATAQVVDWTTTSQSEADRNYGKRMRKAEEREGRERRAWARRCDGHADRDGCDAYHGFTADSVRRQ
ncbi:hypothetical protein [Sphingomonas sp.]|uniref:hypothetical protein n=1 Tax=Sphingomonas sp. TaxID=28214 RepID=UPI003CC57DA0